MNRTRFLDYRFYSIVLVLIGVISLSACGESPSIPGTSSPNATATATKSGSGAQTPIPTPPTPIPTPPTPIPTPPTPISTPPTPIPTPPTPIPTYSSIPCVHVSKNSIALSTNHQQDMFILTNCGPTGSWGSVVFTDNPSPGVPAPINFAIDPQNQPQDGSFPSGAEVSITVYIKSLVSPVPQGHYTGGITINVYGNGQTINGAATVTVSFDAS